MGYIFKLFAFFVAVKFGFSLSFNDGISLVGAAILAACMTAIDSFALWNMKPAIARFMVRRVYEGATSADLVIRTLPVFAINICAQTTMALIVIFSFSRKLWLPYFSSRYHFWENVGMVSLIMGIICLVSYGITIWAYQTLADDHKKPF